MDEAMHGAPHSRLKWVIAGLATTVVLLGMAFVAWQFFASSKVPAELQQAKRAVSFPIYFAATPPPGLVLDRASVSATADVVLFSYTYDGGKRMSVSIQARTAQFDTASFKPTSDFTTHIGHAYVVDLEDRMAAAVVADKSWVLLNVPDKMPADTLRQFIDSLQPVN